MPFKLEKKEEPKAPSFSQADMFQPRVGVADKVLPQHVGALMVDDWSGLVGRYLRTIKDTYGEYWHELELVAQGPKTGLPLGTIYWRRIDKVRRAKEHEMERIAA